MALRDSIEAAMKDALRAKQKDRLAAIRLIMAAIKQREIDERITLDDSQTLAVLEKMAKQRRESIKQFQQADRDDLVAKEEGELAIISGFLPQPLSDAEIDAAINDAIAETGAASVRDMGKVMGVLKPRLQGRADMGAVSAKVKAQLNG